MAEKTDAPRMTEDGHEIAEDGRILIPVEVDDETYAFYAAMVDGETYKTAEEAMSAVVSEHIRELMAKDSGARSGGA